MRKNYNFYINLAFNLVLVLSLSVAVQLIFQGVNICKVESIIYLVFLCFALTLIWRGWRVKVDSSLFVGTLLLGIVMIGLCQYLTILTYADLWPYYFLAVALAHFSVRIVFFDRLQGFLGIISMGIFAFSLIYDLINIHLLWYIVLDVIWLSAFCACYALKSK